MGYRRMPQSSLDGSQVSEDSSCMAPQVHGQNLSNTTSQLPRHEGSPGSPRMSSARSRLPPELPQLSTHCPDTQCPLPSVTLLQGSPSVPPSPHAPGRTQQDPVSLESQALQQATASPVSNQYTLSSSCFQGLASSDHLTSYHGYGGRGTTASFSGIEDSTPQQGWRTHTGYSSPLTSMDSFGLRNSHGSSMELYNAGAAQSNEQGSVVLNEMASWDGRRVQNGFNVSDFHHRSDGSRCPPYRRSATDQREGLTVNPSAFWNPEPIGTSPACQHLVAHSQEIGIPVDQSAFGIDCSLQPPYFSEVHGSFVEDANSTDMDTRNSETEGYLHDPDYLGGHSPSNPSALAPSYAPESENTLSSTSNLTSPLDQGAPSQLAPGSSGRCEICRLNFSNSENRRRHQREQHKDNDHHKCVLSENGLVCNKIIKSARNRRKHVRAVHPGAATLLPPPSTNRRSNNDTDEMLNVWFDRVLKPSAQ